MKPQGYVPQTPLPSDHEPADLEPKLIRRTVMVILITLVVLVVAGLVLFRVFEREYPGRQSEAEPQVTAGELPPVPRPQADPQRELQTVRAQEDAHLERYAWTDSAKSSAQIPVERAMELWVQNYRSPVTNAATTNAATASDLTELQMRQQKAQEAGHAP